MIADRYENQLCAQYCLLDVPLVYQSDTFPRYATHTSCAVGAQYMKSTIGIASDRKHQIPVCKTHVYIRVYIRVYILIIIMGFHDNMYARVNVSGDLAKPFPAKNGVK